MIVRTKEPISFNQWVTQASKFTQADVNLIVRNLPQNTDTSGVAEIRVNVLKPIYQGFEGIITYVQTFTKEVLVDEFNDNGDPTGEQVTQTIQQSIEIIKYRRVIDVATADFIFQQLDQTIDPAIVGFARDRAVVMAAIVADIVQNDTFEGLTAADYDTFIN